jgi:uncharacterized membrane protein
MPFPLRIDATTLPALIFGAGLIIVSILLGLFVWRSRRSLDALVDLDEGTRQHADRQFRRRIQVCVMLFCIGIMIPLGDQLDQVFVKRPIMFLAWVTAVIILALWMILMALGDWLSTMTYSEIAKAQLRFERREIEAEIRRYHASKNGHQIDDLEQTE